jgi:D-alanyl-D-alanine carboxypeptidase
MSTPNKALRCVIGLLVTLLSVWPAQAAAFSWRDVLATVSTPAPPTEITARSYVVLDVKTGRILATRDPHRRQNPASITKLMTALIIAENRANLNTPVTVSAEAAGAEPSKMFLYANEQISAYDLLQGALIASANDAAIALAEWGGDGSGEYFVELMNQKAKALGLRDTAFRNPVGFDFTGHYSTAYDVAMLGFYAIRNPLIREIVDREQTTVFSADGNFRHTLRTTNDLLHRPDIKGLKTGRTNESGESLVLYAERDGLPLIIVVLGATDRFGDGEKLVDWAQGHFAVRRTERPGVALDWKQWVFGRFEVMRPALRFVWVD